MAVYTVHIPPASPGEIPLPERIVFLRDGFSTPAFLFGPFWLAWRRAWLLCVLWTVLLAALVLGGAALGLHGPALSALELVASLALGLEGTRLVAWSLARRGYAESVILVADGIDEAEDVFFASWRPAGDVAIASRPRSGGAAAIRHAIGGLFEEPRQ